MLKKSGQVSVSSGQPVKKPRAKKAVKRPVAAVAKTAHGTKKKSLKPVAQPSPNQPSRTDMPRRLQAPKRIWYKPLTWRNRAPLPHYQPLPKARKLFRATLLLLRTNWKLFAGISVVYGVLNLVLVRGLSGSNDLSSLKSALDSIGSGFGAKITTSFTSFVYLLGTSGSGSSASSGVYQSMLLVICSLAVIWALRQVTAGHTVRIRDSFYAGMYPLIPFLLVFLIISLQLLPLALGGGLYSLVISNGIAVHFWEKAIFLLIFIAAALWSLRMITSSLFALYIVTLPDMTPLKALRSAKSLVYRRRLLIWRKLLFLPIILLLLASIIEVPMILFITPAAVWVFFILSTVALAVVHGYLYTLYRELL